MNKTVSHSSPHKDPVLSLIPSLLETNGCQLTSWAPSWAPVCLSNCSLDTFAQVFHQHLKPIPNGWFPPLHCPLNGLSEPSGHHLCLLWLWGLAIPQESSCLSPVFPDPVLIWDLTLLLNYWNHFLAILILVSLLASLHPIVSHHSKKLKVK